MNRKESKNRMQEMEEKIDQNLKDIEHKLVVMSGKGGVGKSTVAANLATGLSLRGYDVGLLDCDMHGPSIPQIVGISYDEKPTGTDNSLNPISTDYGLKVMSLGTLLPSEDSPVVWRGPLKMKTIQQFLGDVNWGKLDYLVFDLPPGTGDEPLSIAQLIPDSDGAIIVTTPQEVALKTIRRSVNFAQKVELPVFGLIENMSGFVCPHCGEKIEIFHSGGGEELSNDLDIPFLGKIPLDPAVVESGEVGKPIVLEKNSSGAEAFDDIISRVENWTRKKAGGETG
ncbi:hypothetical protein AKJ62_01095 [candidate division MSBL1 archaeon SCGC-AAA259D14]|uniref:Iron-sulfur cluster carrier protein n=1 Tax=candidate division MSBL1 archaeon SCGC-AAA259D14 TaxID=1698261 RepID=A0A133U839_9EURY|nr:hypothetical protein AKJ62_01095 [candidate division MSBL1 archaeon SCGC-AAA259D14]